MERDYQFIESFLAHKNINVLLEDMETIFWVDWREYDEDIVRYCEAQIESGLLFSEVREAPTPCGYDMYVQYQDRNVRVISEGEEDSRDPTFVAINEALNPDYAVRFCVDSVGSDTLAFVILSGDEWHLLEEKFGEDAVQYHFSNIDRTSKMFSLEPEEIRRLLQERGL